MINNQHENREKLAWIIKNQKYLGIGLLIGWFLINIVVLATSTIMEFERMGQPIAAWKPFCWEISSIAIILCLVPLGIWIHDHWVRSLELRHQLAIHLMLTLIFSIIHVIGMVSIRQFCYWIRGEHYDFGSIWWEFFYEYRKDLQTYITLFLVVAGFRLLCRRLQGEASLVAVETKEGLSKPENTPDRFLVKKLGREYLINVEDIEWIEASGNYANLHLANKVYPMRITMEKLAQLLPIGFARIHRSSIVRLDQIKELEPLDSGDYQVTLVSGEKLVLSRRYREEFKKLHQAN